MGTGGEKPKEEQFEALLARVIAFCFLISSCLHNYLLSVSDTFQ